MTELAGARAEPFHLEEATIDELHRAIKAGETTCVAVVRHYIDRARSITGSAAGS
jgi:amidase